MQQLAKAGISIEAEVDPSAEKKTALSEWANVQILTNARWLLILALISWQQASAISTANILQTGRDFPLKLWMLSSKLTGDMPLVLHGGTGIPEDMNQRSHLSLRRFQINVNTECQLSCAATRKYIEAGKDLEGKGFDPRKLLAPRRTGYQRYR